MGRQVIFGGLVGALLVAAALARTPTVEEAIREDPDLSEFYALLERNNLANITLQFRQVTLFAPTNEAFQRHIGRIDDSLVLYHMTNVATPLDQLGHTISSEFDGNPPLFVNRRRDSHHDDIYINNAHIIAERSNYISKNNMGKRQVLHVIDEVLVPVLSSPTSSNVLLQYPDAYQFLSRSEDLAIETHRVRSFRQKVMQNKKEDVFRAEGRHTFFIPVEEGFKPPARPEMIDGKVIDGHVIPNYVLFTHATPNDISYETLAFGDNLKVTVSFTTTREGKLSQTYVKSNTLVGDSKHVGGVVLADIVKANIPVKNGVVHLIQRPLMVVDTTVTQFLAGIDKEDGPLFKFWEVMQDLGGDFLNRMAKMRDLTLFAPSNEAWKHPNLNNLVRNREKLHEILNLHLVRERLPMEKIIQNNINQVATAADRKNLYFNVIQRGNNVTLTIEGGGVNATVLQPNIAATNGIVHIIDHVLGVPYTTVYEKLKTDPMLNDTYYLGRRRYFNEQLNDMKHRFTYFVPRDKAWQKFETEFPSAHRRLFLDDFKDLAKQILERHLIVADRAYTMSDMKLLANETHGVFLPSVRDSLRLRIRESDRSYYVEWQNQWIHVFRPDVECTNGIIHVIDYPFAKENDIRVIYGSGTAKTASVLSIMSATTIMLFSVMWLLR